MNTITRLKALDLPMLFGWFIVYSYIGWVYETIYCSVNLGRYSDRGFMHGPILPIYGSCILFMILLFSERCKSIPSLFLSCAVFASALEYAVSFSMESVFDRRWWNYSSRMFNINGRVCLEAAIVFGISGVLVIRYLHPLLVRYVKENFQPGFVKKANRVLLAIFLIDFIASVQMSLS